jgi:hypothetical protein
MMYGGEEIELNEKLPTSIKLLFDNKYLDCFDILSILYVNFKRKKGIKFEELIYWFSLLNCLNTNNNKYILETTYLQNNYLNSENKLKTYILHLVNQKLINIKSEFIGKKRIMLLTIDGSGINLINAFKNQYFKERISQLDYLKKIRPYTANNEKGVLVNK